MALLSFQPASGFGWIGGLGRFAQSVTMSGIRLVLLEVTRRGWVAVTTSSSTSTSTSVRRRPTQDLKALSTLTNRLLVAFFLTFPFGTHVLDAFGSTSSIVGALKRFLVSFLIYLRLRDGLVMAPFFTKVVRDRLFYNIGPGLAHAFGAATRKTIADKNLDEAISNYMSEQQIGPYGSSKGIRSNFLTSKLVLLLPEDLKNHVGQFKDLSKRFQRKYTEETSRYSPTDSQGLCHYEQMLYRMCRCDAKPTVKPAPTLISTYTSAAQTRSSVSSIVSWDENPNTRWYFRCFDVKPLADIIDFHDEYKNHDINECYVTFHETLKNYLDDYEECRNNYYFLFYQEKLSSSMPQLVQMITEREGKVGFYGDDVPQTSL